MSVIIPIEDVKKYLLRIKEAVSSGKYRYEGRRWKNVRSLAVAGVLTRHVKEYILLLTYLDYFNGPEDERDPNFPPGKYVFFGLAINGHEFFIKLKLEKNDNEEWCVCISFHIAEGPIYYAYK